MFTVVVMVTMCENGVVVVVVIFVIHIFISCRGNKISPFINFGYSFKVGIVVVVGIVPKLNIPLQLWYSYFMRIQIHLYVLCSGSSECGRLEGGGSGDE